MSGLLVSTLLVVACDTAETNELGRSGLSPGGCDAENGTQALHWAPGSSCIWVSYDPALAPFADDLQVALEAWGKLECSGLCFDGPHEDVVDPQATADGRIHFLPTEPASGPIVSTELTYSQDDLTLLMARGHLDVAELEGLDPDLRAGSIIGGLGKTLGLPTSDPGTLSVLANRVDDLAAMPTEADVAAFCAVYGEGGVCEVRP